MKPDPLERFELGRERGFWYAVRRDIAAAVRQSGVLTASESRLRGDRNVERRPGRTCVYFVENPADKNRRFVVRFNTRGGLLGKIVKRLYVLPQARASNELLLSDLALRAGLGVVENVAFSVERRFFPLYATRTISLECSDARDLREILENDPLDRQRKNGISRAVAHEIRRMHDMGFYHADLHAKNVMLDVNGAVRIMDWDKVDFRKTVSVAFRARNLARFLRYCGKFAPARPISAADRVRFLKYYLAGGQEKFLRTYVELVRRFMGLHDIGWVVGMRER